MAPLRPIALLLPSLAGGGAERMTLNLARGLSAQGECVDLVLARAEGPYSRQVPDGVRVIDLASSGMLKALMPLAAYLRRHRPRVLISALSHAGVIAVWAARLAGGATPVVVSVRSCLSIEARRSSRLGDRVMPLMARTFFPRAHAVVAVSQGVAEDLTGIVGLPEPLVRVINNPVVTPELSELAEQEPRHPWLRTGEIPVVLAAGRLTAQKDFLTLLRAFSMLREQRTARLLILGEGPQRQALIDLAQSLGFADSFALPGFEPNPFPSMRAASLFVLSSAWEGLPGVLIQAMACGTPVVATDCPAGPREILHAGDHQFGRLVAVGDDRALADAMAATLNEPRNSERLKRRADAFSLETITRNYLELIRGCD